MVYIGLQDKTRGEVCRILKTVLADEFVLSTRTRNYYWNVTGSHFQELRALFGDQYRRLDDLVATGSLNAYAPLEEILRVRLWGF